MCWECEIMQAALTKSNVGQICSPGGLILLFLVLFKYCFLAFDADFISKTDAYIGAAFVF